MDERLIGYQSKCWYLKVDIIIVYVIGLDEIGSVHIGRESVVGCGFHLLQITRSRPKGNFHFRLDNIQGFQ